VGGTQDAGQQRRTKERLDRGKSVGLSVGFRVQEWTANEDVTDRWGMPQRTITKAELFEVSIVTVPSNPLATVTGAKSSGSGGRSVVPATIREFEEFLREAGFSRSQSEAIASKGFRVIEAAAAPRTGTARELSLQQGEPAPGNDEDQAARLAAEIQRYLAREARRAGIA
jgi:hypothetical protein